MRVHDWAPRLTEAIIAARGLAYVFGDHDCALMAADCAWAVTGRDPASWARGRYASYAGGLKLMKAKKGVASLEAMADTLWPRVAPSMARRGDWALADVPIDSAGRSAPALMVFDGAVIVGPQAIQLPRSLARIAWRVE